MRIVPIIALGVLLGACSNHPIVNDIGRGYSTYSVVHKVRCEAQDALYDHIQMKGWATARVSLPKAEEKLAKLLKNQDKNITRTQAITDLGIITEEIEENRRKLEAVKVQTRALQIRLEQLPAEKIAVVERAILELEELRARATSNVQGVLEQNLAAVKSVQKSIDVLLQEEQQIVEKLRKLAAEIRTRVAINKASNERVKVLEAQLEEIQKANPTIGQLTRLIGNKKLGAPVLRFLNSSIAMQFRFDILENNIAKVDGAYKMPVHAGVLTLGYAAGTDNKRRGERAVGVSTTFGELLEVICDKALSPDDRRAAFYPITGNIGIRELVREYLKISEAATLAQTGGSVGTAKQFTDKIVFTTKINAGLTPKLELNPTPVHKLTLNGELSASREDVHEVIVDIAPPPKPSPAGGGGGTKIIVERVPQVDVNIVRERDIID